MPPGMEEALALRLPRALVSATLARMAFSSEPKMPAGESGEVVRLGESGARTVGVEAMGARLAHGKGRPGGWSRRAGAGAGAGAWAGAGAGAGTGG